MSTFDIVLNNGFGVSDNRLYKAKTGTVEFDSVKDKIKIDGFDDLIEEGERDKLKELLFHIQQDEGSLSDEDVMSLNAIFGKAIEKAEDNGSKKKLVELYNAIIDGFAENQATASTTRLKKQQAFMDEFDKKMKDKAGDTFSKSKEVNSEKAFTYLALNKDEITNFLKSNSGKTVNKDKLPSELQTLLDIANNDGKKLNNILHATEKDRNDNDKGFKELKDYEIRIDGDNVKISKKAKASEASDSSSEDADTNSSSKKAKKSSSTRAHSSSEASGDEEVAEGDSDEEVEDSDRETSESNLKARVEKLTKIEKQIESQLGIGNSGFDGILTDLSPTNKERISNLTERVTMLEEALGESAGGEEFSDSDTKEERLNKIQGKLKYLAKGLNANPEIAANLRNSYAQRSNNGMFGNSNFGGSPYTGGFQDNYGNQHCHRGFRGREPFHYPNNSYADFAAGWTTGGGRRLGCNNSGMEALLFHPRYSDLAAGWVIGGAIGQSLGTVGNLLLNPPRNNNCMPPPFPPYMPPSGCYGLYT